MMKWAIPWEALTLMPSTLSIHSTNNRVGGGGGGGDDLLTENPGPMKASV